MRSLPMTCLQLKHAIRAACRLLESGLSDWNLMLWM